MGSLRDQHNPTCHHCGTRLTPEERTRIKDRWVCPDCADSQYLTCHCCEKNHEAERNYDFDHYGGYYFCPSCRNWIENPDEYEPDEAELSRLVGLIEQWDRGDVRDLREWLAELQTILSPNGESVWDYVSLPPVNKPEDIEESIEAIDTQGRCLMEDCYRIESLASLKGEEEYDEWED